jgi:hypothetical protein
MKFWLHIPCKDLEAPYLVDEHRSMHAYFGGLIKNFNKWSEHTLWKAYNPMNMYKRHQEQVIEFAVRGWIHKSPLNFKEVLSVNEKYIERIAKNEENTKQK